MFTKAVIAAALAIPAIALSSMTYAANYVGGPKSGIPMSTTNQAIEINKPYAQYVPGAVSTHNHIYRGGPQTVVPHDR